MTTYTRLTTRQRLPGRVTEAAIRGLVGQRTTIVSDPDNIFAVLIPSGEAEVIHAELVRYGSSRVWHPDVIVEEVWTEVMISVQYSDEDPEPPTELAVRVVDHTPSVRVPQALADDTPHIPVPHVALHDAQTFANNGWVDLGYTTEDGVILAAPVGTPEPEGPELKDPRS